MNLNPFGGSTFMAIAGAVVLAVASWIGVQQLEIHRAESRLAAKNLSDLQDQLKAEQDAAAELNRRLDAQRTISNEAQKQLEHTASNSVVARAATDRLFKPAPSKVANHPAAASEPADAAQAGILLPDVYGQLVARARQMADRINDLDDYADTLRIKGDGLEQSYDSLNNKSILPEHAP